MMVFGYDIWYKPLMIWLSFLLYPSNLINRFVHGAHTDILAQRNKILRNDPIPQT